MNSREDAGRSPKTKSLVRSLFSRKPAPSVRENVRSISRLVRTVRHLKPQQIVHQVRHRLRPYVEQPTIFLGRENPAYPGIRWSPGFATKLFAPGEQRNQHEDLIRGNFTFLNETRTLSFPPRWIVPGASHLWQYNLHYFEWLWSLPFPEARQVTLDWIQHHTLAKGQVGWEPYPISLRLMSWCSVFFAKYHAKTRKDAAFTRQLWESIATQTRWLNNHLEFHLMGNHLLENAAALFFVGRCFRGADADYWLLKGKRLLQRELKEQILPDGMHFERSPMYHTRILYLLLQLHTIGDSELQQTLSPRIQQMARALAKTCHPDGDIALLNDSAFGIYNPPGALLKACQTLFPGEHLAPQVEGPWSLAEAGYYGFRDKEGNYIICDAGPIGPDYLPGHAHGDIFSFALSYKGHRIFTDSGVHDYEVGPMREYCRSTAAHNTVTLNDRSQCEFWGAFRVGRRGRPHEVSWTPEPDGFTLSGWHDGYSDLPGAPRHQRSITWRDQSLTIQDKVESTHPVSMRSRLHLHPSCQILSIDGKDVQLDTPAGPLSLSFLGDGVLTAETSTYCPEFGQTQSRQVLLLSAFGKSLQSGFRSTF